MKKKIHTGCKQTSELVSGLTVGSFIIFLIMWLLVYFYMELKVAFLVKFQTNYGDYNSIITDRNEGPKSEEGNHCQTFFLTYFLATRGQRNKLHTQQCNITILQRHAATSAIIWSCVHVQLANVSPMFTLLLAPFLVPTSSRLAS